MHKTVKKIAAAETINPVRQLFESLRTVKTVTI